MNTGILIIDYMCVTCVDLNNTRLYEAVSMHICNVYMEMKRVHVMVNTTVTGTLCITQFDSLSTLSN